jgi:hypothetical protein
MYGFLTRVHRTIQFSNNFKQLTIKALVINGNHFLLLMADF